MIAIRKVATYAASVALIFLGVTLAFGGLFILFDVRATVSPAGGVFAFGTGLVAIAIGMHFIQAELYRRTP